MQKKIEERIEELRQQNRMDREFIEILDITNPRDKKTYDNTKQMILMRSYATCELEKILKEIEVK